MQTTTLRLGSLFILGLAVMLTFLEYLGIEALLVG